MVRLLARVVRQRTSASECDSNIALLAPSFFSHLPINCSGSPMLITRQGLATCSVHSGQQSCIKQAVKEPRPANHVESWLPGITSSIARSGRVGLPQRGFAVKAAQQQQQQQVQQEDALLQSASQMRHNSADTIRPSESTSDPSQAYIEGTIQRITFSAQDTGYTVAKLKVDSPSAFIKSKSKNGVVTITGSFPDMSVGKRWRCSGSWLKHSVYGHQMLINAAEELAPSTDSDLIAYLCGGATKGVGPVTAKNMVEKYGDKILDILDTPEAAAKLQKVKGIGKATAAKIKTEWDNRRGDRAAREFLQKHGMTGANAQRLVQRYGSTTEEVVRQDPYTCLTAVATHSSFRAAEKLAEMLGTPAELPSRAASAMQHALSMAAGANGHTYLSWDQLQRDTLRLMSGRPWEGPGLQEVAQAMFKKGELMVEGLDSPPLDAPNSKPNWEEPLRCYSPVMYEAEVTVANKLAELAARRSLAVPQQSILNWLNKQQGLQLSEGQKEAILLAATSPVCVLTGGPGCGKTTITKYIVNLWQSQGKRMALCAPTGRASQRLTETSGKAASTIHRLLKWIPAKGEAGRAGQNDAASDEDGKLGGSSTGQFQFNSHNPLAVGDEWVDIEQWKEVDAVLVDEASMLDLPLAAALLDALPRRCQLVFVGDVDQLPPVGPGKVLSDAIQSGVIPGVDLRQIFRQAQQSNIVRTAHAVNHGDWPAVMQGLPALSSNDLQSGAYSQGLPSDAVMMVANASWVQNAVEAALRQVVHPLGRFDILRDVQVMSPMRKQAAGVNQLNAALQALLNPPSHTKPELSLGRLADSFEESAPTVLRQGDRVIQCSNNYQKDVFNGDVGFVGHVDKSDRQLTVRFHDDKEVVYVGAELNELQLAWATTVHKSQGSECPVVVLALAPNHRPLLTRRLLYTALTRAKQLVIVVGSPDAVKMAVEAEKSDQRMSTLQQRITAVAIKAGAPADQKMLTFGSDEITLPAAEAEQPLPAANQLHVPLQVQQQPSVLQKHIEAQQAPPQQLPQHLSQQQPQQVPQQQPQQVAQQVSQQSAQPQVPQEQQQQQLPQQQQKQQHPQQQQQVPQQQPQQVAQQVSQQSAQPQAPQEQQQQQLPQQQQKQQHPQQQQQLPQQQQQQQQPQQVPRQWYRQYQQQQRMNAYRHRQNMARQRQERPSVPEAPQETLYARSGYSQR